MKDIKIKMFDVSVVRGMEFRIVFVFDEFMSKEQ